MTAGEHVRAVLGKGAKERAGEFLDWFDLGHLEGRVVGRLSGGERARLSIARAVAGLWECEGGVLVMDEPMVSVGKSDARRYWEVIRGWRGKTGGSIVFSTHLPDLVIREAERIVCIDEGEVLWEGEVTELYENPLSEKLGAMLGELNWFEGGEMKVWLSERGGGGEKELGSGNRGSGGRQEFRGCGVRPEWLEVVGDGEERFVCEGSVRIGAIVESVVRDEVSGMKKVVIHVGDEVKEGERVRIVLKRRKGSGAGEESIGKMKSGYER